MAFNITIDQEEIETAIQNHVRSKVAIAEGQHVSIEMKAGRGENGFTATIAISDTPVEKTAAAPVAQAETAAPVTRVNGKVVESKPDPEPATVAVAEEVEETAATAKKLFGGTTTGRNIE